MYFVFRVGTHLLRMAGCVRGYVQAKLQLKTGPPPDYDERFTEMLLDYAYTMHGSSKEQHNSTSWATSSRSRKGNPYNNSRCYKALVDYLHIVNGGFFDGDDMCVSIL